MTGKNNIINLLFSADKNYIQHLVVVLQSIYENNRENKFKLFLFVSDNVGMNEKLLCTVKELGFECEVINVDPADFSAFHTSHHATVATYYRLNLAKLLPEEIDKILYLDVDLIVKGDLKELWDTDISDYAIGAVREISFKRYAELGIPSEYTYFNAGIMLINVDYFRKNNFFDTAVNYYRQRKEQILWWDQDILNGLLYDKVYLLPYKWNVKTGDFQPEILPPAERLKWNPDISKDVKIIHFTGSFKPWHYKNNHPRKEEYFYYLRKTRFKRYNPLIEHLKIRIINKLHLLLK